ncbi:tumor necrosis factor ligand superfamily member 14 isoform X2 [Denticeps clupeoides]|uniref:tumor necrosis factor ligand superfamily member 14 isoform X2 n=1 Tax=Denticeps clupeoides TaxID=299321 RepID=UPI0010A429CD|nr:tumor necrosis factor ligand superfamily member 14-like isoform X2 [Denticeps clupeoides]
MSKPYPSVFVVDNCPPVQPPPLPPKPRRKKDSPVVQTVLILLVGLALCGMTAEACFILHLYNMAEATMATRDPVISAQMLDKTVQPDPAIPPSKPLAHVTSPDRTRGDGVLRWADNSILFGVTYEDGQLVFQKEGYYSVYSKICFTAEHHSISLHSVFKRTQRYPKPIPLMQDRTRNPKATQGTILNSYLAGVFHFFPTESIFVKVNNHTSVMLSNSEENYFGVYML